MSAINELKEGLAQTETAQFVTTMLRDISATKLQSIRARFEANLTYFKELHELMSLVQEYADERATGEKAKIVPHQKVYVAVTSNKRFYGTLNHEIIHALHDALLDDVTSDCVVVGQTGRQIVDVAPLPSNPRFIAFLKDEPTEAELLSCIMSLSSYHEIVVIHPTFVNSFQQHAFSTDLTHVASTQKSDARRTIDYMFEPDIPKIITFFQTQIRLVLFSRVMLETQLALTGARLMKMQRARERAGELVIQQSRTIHKEMSTMKGMRLLETFAGFHGTKTP